MQLTLTYVYALSSLWPLASLLGVSLALLSAERLVDQCRTRDFLLLSSGMSLGMNKEDLKTSKACRDSVVSLLLCAYVTPPPPPIPPFAPPCLPRPSLAALGMNEEELKTNKDCSEYVVHDLNLEPALPFPDNTFDIITNAVSVDYLNKPLEVFQEMHRYAWASRKKLTEKIKQ